MSDSDSWKIPASAEQCARCETALAVGDEVTVFLRFGEEGPHREDLCASCGNAVSASGSDVFWRHKLPESAVASPVVDYALLREMFHRMLVRPEPVYQRLSYLVGLVLVRKRHLRLRGFERRGGTEVMVVSKGAGEPDLDVPAPHLSAEALVETREQLTRLLAADLPSEDFEGVGATEAASPDKEPQAEGSQASGDESPPTESSAEDGDGLDDGDGESDAPESQPKAEAASGKTATSSRRAGKAPQGGTRGGGRGRRKGAVKPASADSDGSGPELN